MWKQVETEERNAEKEETDTDVKEEKTFKSTGGKRKVNCKQRETTFCIYWLWIDLFTTQL